MFSSLPKRMRGNALYRLRTSYDLRYFRAFYRCQKCVTRYYYHLRYNQRKNIIPPTPPPPHPPPRISDLYRNSLNHSKNEKTSNNTSRHYDLTMSRAFTRTYVLYTKLDYRTIIHTVIMYFRIACI